MCNTTLSFELNNNLSLLLITTPTPDVLVKLSPISVGFIAPLPKRTLVKILFLSTDIVCPPATYLIRAFKRLVSAG